MSDAILIKPTLRRYILFQGTQLGFFCLSVSLIAFILILSNSPITTGIQIAVFGSILGQIVALVIVAKPYLDHHQIVISDGSITGPEVWKRRITFPLRELDKVKNSQQKLKNTFWNTYYIYSQNGQKTYLNSFLFDQAQLDRLRDILASA
jgi:hypothetical protein